MFNEHVLVALLSGQNTVYRCAEQFCAAATTTEVSGMDSSRGLIFQRHHNQFLCPLQRTKVSSEILQVVLHHKDLEIWVGELGMS